MHWLERSKQKHRKICPDCKLVNPASAEVCYCGHTFRIDTDDKAYSFRSRTSMIVFTVFVMLMMGFLIFSIFEGVIFASCARTNIY